MTDEEERQQNTIEIDNDQSAEPARVNRRTLRVLGYVFIGLAVLVAIYGTIFFVAWDRGQLQRAQEEQTALDSELEKQIKLAREETISGNYDLAIRRLEWILERDPDFPEAASLMNQALLNLNEPDTPTPMLRETSTPDMTSTPAIDPEPAVAFAALEDIMDQEEWEQAIFLITAFQSEYPDYLRRQTDSLLYDAYLNLGQLLVMGDQVELGLFYFDQAEKLGDLPVEAEDQRTWADLYLLGISYYGVDWGTAIFYFRGLCAAAPFYQDACVKLREVLIAYGDQYVLNLDYCPAEALYAEANRQSSDTALIDKLQTSREQCLEATPTPTVSPTLPLSGTATIESSLPMTILTAS